MFRSLIVGLLSLGVSMALFANSTAQDFEKSKRIAKSLSAQPLEAMKGFVPGAVFENYQEHQDAERHYQGIEQEKVDLSLDATQALKDDKGGLVVTEHFGESQFRINTNNEAIKQAKLIEEESYAITHGMSNDRVNCEQQAKQCTFKAHEEICHTSRVLADQQCVKNLKVSVEAEHVNQRADFEVWIAKNWTGYITINLITGAMSNNEGGHLTNPLKLNHACETMRASIHSVLNNGGRADWVGVASLPTCKNNATITLYVSKKFKRYYPIQVALTIDASSKPYVVDEQWENQCQKLEESGLCHLKEEQCTDSEGTKVINGLPVTRACWTNNLTFSCNSAKTDECKVQREKGCLQLSSHCKEKDSTSCTLYEQTYSCQEEVCETPVTCLKNLFCVDGDCTDQVATQNENFGKDLAALSVVGEGAKEFNTTQSTLFAGKPVQCKIWFWDIVDCCSNKGWADKININLCREEDKALGRAKLNYLAHYVGSYCSTRDPILGACLEHKRTYCVFDSKMARIIQEGGRLSQLNANGLGDAEFTTCDGLSVAELQRLDMGRIDFLSPIYPYPNGVATKEAGIIGDVTLQAPNPKLSSEEIEKRIQQKAAKL